MIDWTKPLRTINTHIPVEFISDNGRGKDKYLVYIGDNKYITCFNEKGEADYISHRLENVPEKKVRWINIYKSHAHLDAIISGSSLYLSREEASNNASAERIACIQIEFEEGEGL